MTECAHGHRFEITQPIGTYDHPLTIDAQEVQFEQGRCTDWTKENK